MCNYKNGGGRQVKSPLWYSLETADNCLTVHSLNFSQIPSDPHSSWPGYDSSFTSMFGSYFTAYFHAQSTGNYTFQIVTRQVVNLYLDDDETPLLVGRDTSGRDKTYTEFSVLKVGYHFIRIMWTNYAAYPRLQVSIGLEDQLHVLDDTNSRVGGLAPVALHFPPIAAVVGQPVAIAPKPYGGTAIREVTVQPALPAGLAWNAETGRIEGTVSVETRT